MTCQKCGKHHHNQVYCLFCGHLKIKTKMAKWLTWRDACSSGLNWWVRIGQPEAMIDIIEAAIKDREHGYLAWLFGELTTRKSRALILHKLASRFEVKRAMLAYAKNQCARTMRVLEKLEDGAISGNFFDRWCYDHILCGDDLNPAFTTHKTEMEEIMRGLA